MTVARQDAWTVDEDLVLAELVLAHIREGSTQLQAFQEAGKRLKRTAAACGFRWNSNIRKQYKTGIELAKNQKKLNKKEGAAIYETDVTQDEVDLTNSNQSESIMLSDAVGFFQKLEKELALTEKYKFENEQLKVEISNLKAEKIEAEKDVERATNELKQLKEEYRSLITMLDKARKFAGVLAEKDVDKQFV